MSLKNLSINLRDPETRKRLLRGFVEYVVIALGAFLVALGANIFLIPNQVVSGGVTGIAIISHHTLGTPVGIVLLVLNVPLFLAGLKWGGGVSTGVRTVFAVIVMSFFIDFLQPRVPTLTHDPLLYTVYGGILDGLGLGLVLRFQGTTGGTDILAMMAKRFLNINYGVTLLVANAVIISAAGLVFGLEAAMYAMILAAVSSKVIDLVQEGEQSTRSVTIVSRRPAEVQQTIFDELGRGVTVLHGRGGYTDADREVLLCAVQRNEISRLKRMIQAIDPEAFVIIGSVHEVLGEGFQGMGVSAGS